MRERQAWLQRAWSMVRRDPGRQSGVTPGPTARHVAQPVEGRVVLVTGAGTPAGAELSRQVAARRPARLLLVDHDEQRLIETWLSLEAPSPARWDDLVTAHVHEVEEALRAGGHPVPHVVLHADPVRTTPDVRLPGRGRRRAPEPQAVPYPV